VAEERHLRNKPFVKHVKACQLLCCFYDSFMLVYFIEGKREEASLLASLSFVLKVPSVSKV